MCRIPLQMTDLVLTTNNILALKCYKTEMVITIPILHLWLILFPLFYNAGGIYNGRFSQCLIELLDSCNINI